MSPAYICACMSVNDLSLSCNPRLKMALALVCLAVYLQSGVSVVHAICDVYGRFYTQLAHKCVGKKFSKGRAPKKPVCRPEESGSTSQALRHDRQCRCQLPTNSNNCYTWGWGDLCPLPGNVDDAVH